ncbi:hypothetical protein [Streptomyces sp. NPDC003077]|uniref:hypothetical protein n=1 Tax=Streptomyces sp. NPDC003077 TaxID=3154443 RepID=UPI0033A8576F
MPNHDPDRHLDVDIETVQGWESGRRPVANVRAGTLLDLRRRLPALSADAGLVEGLSAAMDADRFLAARLGEDVAGRIRWPDGYTPVRPRTCSPGR